MAKYCDKNELAERIRQYQIDKIMTNELYDLLVLIGSGVFQRYSHLAAVEKDEFVQDGLVRFLETAHKIDPEQNCFNYCTQMFIYTSWENYRQHEQRKRKLDRYAKHLGWDGQSFMKLD